MTVISTKIHYFRVEEEAKAFFENMVKESEEFDGFWIKESGFTSTVAGRSGEKRYIDEDPVFIVVRYPNGTPFAIDSGKADAALAAPAPDPTPAPTPTDGGAG
ncbi:MAG: hypothetical protein AAFR32_08860 [Pseudomonadota bacterium]